MNKLVQKSMRRRRNRWYSNRASKSLFAEAHSKCMWVKFKAPNRRCERFFMNARCFFISNGKDMKWKQDYSEVFNPRKKHFFEMV